MTRNNDATPLIIELLPGVREVQPSDMEHVQFKRKKFGNVRYREYTNPSGQQFKVSDPCDVDLLCPYDKDEFICLNKWLVGLVDNSQPIELGVDLSDTQFFFFSL